MGKPRVRIQGFSGEWSESRLRDFTSRVVRKNTGLQSNLPLTVSAQYGLVGQDTFFNSRIASSNLAGYYLLKKGEFAYNKSSSQGYPYGAVKRLDLHENGVLSTLYIVFDVDKEKVDSDYVVSYFDAATWHNEVRLRAAEGARNHGLLNISTEDFFDIKILLPENVDEQWAIGAFFKFFNQGITNLTDKIIVLKSLKTCCLCRLLCIGGGYEPSIRLKNFSGHWKEEKAGKIFQSVSDKGHPDLPVLSATQDRGMIIRDESEKIVIHDKRNEVGYKRVVPGQFVIHLRSFQGGFAHSAVEGITSPAYTVMEFIHPEEHDDRFWKYVFNSKEFIHKLRTVTYGIRDGRNISYEEFLGMSLKYPTKEEQTQIADILEELDKEVKIHEEELERLKAVKLSCLEGMFV